MVQPRHGRTVIGIAKSRSRPEQLVEGECAVEDIAARETEPLLQIERGQGLSAQNAGLEAGRIALNRFDHEVGDFFPMIVPGGAARQLRSYVLTEQACDMCP